MYVSSPPLLLSYRFPFLLVSLKIGLINILLLANTKAPKLQKIILIHACSQSCFTSDFFIVFKLIWLTWEIFKVPFTTASSRSVVHNAAAFISGAHSSCWLWGDVACSDCRTGISYSLCASLKYFRCLSIYLCYHTSLWPRNLCAYQSAKVGWSLLIISITLLLRRCPSWGGWCPCSV